MKKIAVIILNWNGADLLRKFLPSVCAHTNAHIADVIVVDNGSDDNSVEVLKQEFPQVKTLLFPQNCGFAAGYNKALEMLDYKYAVLLNSDVETTPHWLEPLLEFAEDNPDVAACQPKIKSLRRREKFEYAVRPADLSTATVTRSAGEESSIPSKPTGDNTTIYATSSGPAARLFSFAPKSIKKSED